MAKHKPRSDLTPVQEIVIRDFLEGCAELQIVLDPQIPVMLMARLGYRLIPKKSGTIAIRADLEVKNIYGDPDPFKDYEDQYGTDGEAVRELANGVVNDSDTDEASPSQSPEGDTVGSVLQQDV
jgi:hypothetical protein